MDNLPLRNFATPIPSYLCTASWAGLVAMLEHHDCERAVILNEQDHPLGIIYLHQLLPHLVGIHHQTLRLALPEQSLQQFLRAHPRLLTPITVLSADLSLLQSWQRLQPGLDASLVVVDSQGTLVGMVDPIHLVRYLQRHLVNDLIKADLTNLVPPSPSGLISPSIPSSPGQLSPRLPSLHVLIQLLDQMPLPIMLQTSSGQVLMRNDVWRHQVSELQNPTLIQQAAAQLLDHESAKLTSTLVETLEAAEAAPAPNEDPSSSQEVCQLGADMNTCVCICPMKDGYEKVWQFTKIPLQVSLSPGRDINDVRVSMSPSFHLGTLGEDLQLANELGQTTLSPEANDTVWLLLAQDRTEQQQVTKELAARNADLIQLNRMKDEFLACISHELKTPLTAILGLSSLLKETVLGELNDRQSRYVHLIHQSGRHLVSIVNDILDLTRMETGQLELVLESVNIADMCAVAYHQAKSTTLGDLDATNRSAAAGFSAETAWEEPLFQQDIEPGLDHIVADSLRLRQMLTHLLSNALKFTEGRQELGLKVNRWDGWIAFTVWDTGIGIPADKQHLIFQKFQQLESPLTRRFEGTGLGLVLTQRLARLHGGEVTFVSKPGEGSQFTLLLPPSPPGVEQGHPPTPGKPVGRIKDPSATAPLPQSPTQVARLSNRLVLLVESSAQQIDTLSESITELGYRVAIARSGTEALEKIRRLQPCIVFLNPSLPLLSGWDVLTLLKSDPETRNIPVVVMAAIADRSFAASNQADELLTLPIQPDQLRQVLTTLADWGHTSTPAPRPLPVLTVMLLDLMEAEDGDRTAIPNSAESLQPKSVSPLTNIAKLLQASHHRLLEVDDLDQADLLARVWKPDVMILNQSSPQAFSSIHRLSEYPVLAALPIVTLSSATTEAANQVGALSIFPCLIEPTANLSTLSGQPKVSAILQVIQVAAGLGWKPSILMVDLADVAEDETFLDQGHIHSITEQATNAIESSSKAATDWLQVLHQYLQTAGFLGRIGHSWLDVLHHLHHQTIDLLVIYLHDEYASETIVTMTHTLQTLEHLAIKPPILVLDHRQQVCYSNRHVTSASAHASVTMSDHSTDDTDGTPPLLALSTQLEAIATDILPAATPVSSLLDTIKTLLRLS